MFSPPNEEKLGDGLETVLGFFDVISYFGQELPKWGNVCQYRPMLEATFLKFVRENMTSLAEYLHLGIARASRPRLRCATSKRRRPHRHLRANEEVVRVPVRGHIERDDRRLRDHSLQSDQGDVELHVHEERTCQRG